jgi:hypothetical protein
VAAEGEERERKKDEEQEEEGISGKDEEVMLRKIETQGDRKLN